MTKIISVSQYQLKADLIETGAWVVSREEDAIGIITDVRKGESDSYVFINWFDGGPTQHSVSDLIRDDVVKGATASSSLPDWAR